ncbi:MAG: V-type ATPase subunit [Candidatus Eremiobacteraeota bacterium]|nr:V-type ATPase subunit [Candidatus Eremiobacteraeota bacterium]
MKLYKDYPVITATTKYAFAGARLALLEKELITQTEYEQLKVCETVSDMAKLLSDTVYQGKFETGMDIGTLVEEETLRFKKDLYEIMPEDDYGTLDAFFRKYDHNNLKICLKTYLIGNQINPDELSKVGSITPEDLASYFEGERMVWLPFNVDFKRIQDIYKKEKEMRLIDAIVDRAYYSELLNTIKKLGDDFFVDYIYQMLDLKNILIFIRCKTTGLALDRFLLKSGYISRDAFDKFIDEPNIDVAFSSPYFITYRDVYQKGLETLEKTNSYAELETAVRNHLISILKEVQDSFFSIRPFLGYLLGKEHEISLIKKAYIHIHNRIEFGKERDLLYV